MNRAHCRTLLALAALLALIPAARAQNLPHLGYAYPAGGRVGTTFQVKLGGQFLTSNSLAIVSGQGVRVTVSGSTRPLSQKDFQLLRDQLRALQAKWQASMRSRSPWRQGRWQGGANGAANGKGNKKGNGKGNGNSAALASGKGKTNGNGNQKSAVVKTPQPGAAVPAPQPPPGPWTAADERAVIEIMKKLANPPIRQGNPALAETVTLQVTIDAGAEPGMRELRLVQPNGISNPLVFQVSQLPEFYETPERDTTVPDSIPELRAFLRSLPKKKSQSGGEGVGPDEINAVMDVSLPATLNGQILPGDVDRFRFQARQGQRLVIAASARALIPYLADAVPGWFQATLALYDDQGKEVAYDDDFRFNPDPVLFYQIPRDGAYEVEIKDAIYRGREDFVYRIAIGELPFVTGIFPLGGRAGVQTTVEMTGWNLPVAKLAPNAAQPGTYLLSERKGELISNGAPFAVDTLPECLEKEGNNTPGSAQAVTLPAIVNGRIDRPGDVDVFRFEGRGGSRIVAEVDARRLNSPLDSVLRLTDAGGKQLAFNDDTPDKGAGLLTHQADSLLSATLPSDGTYYLHLGDTQHKGGGDYAYRLRISPPQPGFDLRVVPSSLGVRGGATVPITVVAVRRDGFAGDIQLALKNAPEGFFLSGARVPAGQDQVRCTLTVPPAPQTEPYSLVMEGRAQIEGREIVKQAVPAEDMMQAFFYRHLVPEKEMRVAVEGRYMTRSVVRVASPSPVRIPAGGTARVRLDAPKGGVGGKIQLELSEPPDGITIKGFTPSRTGGEVELACDAKVKPGLKGNLIVQVFAQRPPVQGKKAQSNTRPPTPQATLPAISFDVVPPGTDVTTDVTPDATPAIPQPVPQYWRPAPKANKGIRAPGKGRLPFAQKRQGVGGQKPFAQKRQGVSGQKSFAQKRASTVGRKGGAGGRSALPVTPRSARKRPRPTRASAARQFVP